MDDEKIIQTNDDTWLYRKAGIAIAGIGELTESQLLPAFAESRYTRPVGLISDDETKLIKTGAKYGIEKKSLYTYENFDNIINNTEIDGVYIVLPNSKHKEFATRAAKAGKHVLCEKPMAMSAKEAQEMIDICREEKRLLMVAYRIQYEPHNQLIKEWVQNNVFGKVKLIECLNAEYIDDASQWRFKKALAGGGVLMDLGIYCVNTIRYITGLEPLWVSANTYSSANDDRFKEVEETVLFQMGLPGGTLATCGTSYGIYGAQKYRCYTEKDAWFGVDPAFAYKDLKIEISTSLNGENFPLPVIKQENQFAAILDHFGYCILNNQVPNTPGEEGLRDHLVMEAIYRSATQQRVIYL